MKLIVAATLLASAALCAVTTAHAAAPTDPESVTDRAVGVPSYVFRAVAKKAVEDLLTDPESARFDWIVSGKWGGKVVICGNVNAKNQMGGYAGKQPFMVIVDPPNTYTQIGEDYFSNGGNVACGKVAGN